MVSLSMIVKQIKVSDIHYHCTHHLDLNWVMMHAFLIWFDWPSGLMSGINTCSKLVRLLLQLELFASVAMTAKGLNE